MPRNESTGTALYFPNIEIADRTWLKSALLYWDTIRRIVPRSVKPNDDEDVAELAASGVVINTEPEQYAAGTEVRFRKAWTPKSVTALKVAFGSNRFRPAENGRTPEEEKWYWMYPEKMTHQLRHDFESQGDLMLKGRMARVSPGIAQLYMTCLAAEMGDQIGVPTVTDKVSRAKAGEFLRFEDGFDRRSEQRITYEQAMLRLQLPIPIPAELQRIPLHEVVAFRERYKDERRAFRGCVEGFLSRIVALEDPNAVDDAVRDAQIRLKKVEADYRGSMAGLFGDVISNAVDFTLALGAGNFAAAQLPGSTLVKAVSGTLAGAGVWIYRNLKAARQTRQSSPWRYVACLRKLRK